MKLFTIKINLIVLILFVLTDASCDWLFSNNGSDNHVLEHSTDGIELKKVYECRLDAIQIIEAVENIQKRKFNEVHSMLIYINVKLVFEEYLECHPHQSDTFISYSGLSINILTQKFHDEGNEKNQCDFQQIENDRPNYLLFEPHLNSGIIF